MAQYGSAITKAFRVSANCFRPRPEVGSAVALFETRQNPGLTRRGEERFAVLVKAAFAHRRKTMVNSLRDEGHDQMLILKMLDELSLSPTVRAETLPLAMFVEMARFYEANA
jgi:16S rRNA (adenine1518-N6/adenine1519-N6)-dimethyltransferase